MADDRVRVNPQSVVSYGQNAQGQFNTIHAALVGLVDQCTTVDYYGENAVQFKTKCGQKAADFGQAFSRDLAQIAEAVKTSSSNIAQALGGQPISISVSGAPIPLPAVPPGDGSVEASTSGLTQLITQVGQQFSIIQDALDQHLASLRTTDWLGNAKDQAMNAVTSYTTKAKSAAGDAQQQIAKFIQDQIEAVQKADA